MTAHTDVSGPLGPVYPHPLGRGELILLASGILLTAALAAAGVGPLAVMLLPVLASVVLAVLGQATAWLWLLVVVSGVGLSWAEGGVRLGGWHINIAGLQWGMTFVLGAMLLLLLPRTGERWPAVFRWYAAFVALAVIGVLRAPDLFAAVKHTIQYAAPLVVGLVTMRAARRPGDVGQLRGAFWVAFMISVVIALASLQWSTFAGGGAGLVGTLGEESFGIFLIPIYALALGAWHNRGAGYALIAAVAFVIILLTLARTVTAVALVLLAVTLAWNATWTARLRTALLLGVMAALILSFEPFRERMFTGESLVPRERTELVSGEGREAQLNVRGISLSGRGLLWLQTWRHAQLAPVTGQGTGSAETFLATELQFVTNHPHNDYLRVFHDAGAIGLGVMLAMAAAGLVALRNLHRRSVTRLGRELSLAAFLTWVAYLLIAVTDNVFVYVSIFTQNLFLLIALAYIVVEREPETGAAATGAAA